MQTVCCKNSPFPNNTILEALKALSAEKLMSEKG